jgi:23S rRNA pseudoU1915 N3-methylase RlmH
MSYEDNDSDSKISDMINFMEKVLLVVDASDGFEPSVKQSKCFALPLGELAICKVE